MKKVLITGGAGFIGSHIVDKLIMNDYKVVIIDNLLTGSINNLPQSDKIEFYKNDIYKDDIEFIFDRERPDFCIHLAAQTSVAYSEKEDELINEMLNVLNNVDNYKTDRKKIRDELFTYQDGKNCERIIEFIRGLNKK